MNVTTRHPNKTGFLLKDSASGLYFQDARSDFQVIAVAVAPDSALSFPDTKAAEQARRMIAAFFGSFDFRTVEA
jgi:hypothetical protein